MVWPEKDSKQVARLLENQRSLDVLRLDFRVSGDKNIQLNVHPDLKIRKLIFVGVKFFRYSGFCSKKENTRRILQHFNTVKALSLGELPSDESFYRSAPVNTELTELDMRCPINCRALHEVFTIFPSLKILLIKVDSLDVSALTQEELIQMHWNLSLLERLTVVFGFECDFAAFRELSQEITDLYLKMNFFRTYKSLKVVCRNVNFLSIEGDGGSDVRLDPKEILECFPRLKTLQLSFNAFDAFKPNLLEAIKESGKNLKLQFASKDLVRTFYQEALS